MASLQNRILLAATLVLLLFLLLTSLALEQAFRDTARSAREERLLSQVYLLLAAAELEDGQLVLPKDLAEPRLNLPGSGLYARVFDATGDVVWESASAIGETAPPYPLVLEPGKHRSRLIEDDSERGYLTQSFGVLWATGQPPQAFTFAVAEDLAALEQELVRFRNSLGTTLSLMALLLLGALFFLMRWGLGPLRRVAAEVAAVESGSQTRIHGEYPAELHSLTHNLNALLAHERAQQRRLDHALGDLAHSLKTPLAVLRTAVGEAGTPPATVALLHEQLGRMDHMVDYQLQRARSGAGAAAGLAPPVAIRQVIERLVAALTKVYRDKPVSVALDCDPQFVFRGPEGDLMEILGNLLDNAFKWSHRQVRIRVTDQPGLLIAVEDDGPGIPPELCQHLLERGTRADELTPGHGIGLAVVRELCAAYGGDLKIERSALGGALVEARTQK